MRAPSQLPLHPLAWLRLKLTSDETKEEQKKAGETSEPATLVIGELRFITLQGNNVLFFPIMNHYYWWQISKTLSVKFSECTTEGTFFSFVEVPVAGLTEAIVGNGLLQEINAFAGLYRLALWHQSVLINLISREDVSIRDPIYLKRILDYVICNLNWLGMCPHEVFSWLADMCYANFFWPPHTKHG